MGSGRRALWVAFVVTAAGVAGGVVAPARPAAALAVPAGFVDEVLQSGLNFPANLAIAPDGRIFVAERVGTIRTMVDEFAASTQVADLRASVYNGGDRGLLGLAVHPQFPAQPYVYVAYSYDGLIAGPSPKYGGGTDWDPCPDTNKSCPIGGRIGRLTWANGVLGSEKVLVEDYCNQFLSHSLGDLAFGADGYLYATGGDGASYLVSDYGQLGNGCGDPPGAVGDNLTPPTAMGGSLRAQSARRAPGLPVSLSGAMVRIDPSTGAAAPGNPWIADANSKRRRIIAYGLRNAFRFTFRPGTNELYIGDVGAGEWEEINHIPNPTDGVADNFGWPCYEGPPKRIPFDNLDLDLCETLYTEGTARAASFAYQHREHVVAGDACPVGQSSTTGLAFYDGTAFPARYRGGLFFADYSRGCIYFAPSGVGGAPDFSKVEVFESEAAGPVDLLVTRAGHLLYPDIANGAIRRIRFAGGTNGLPVARPKATPASGAAPLTVAFDATASSDPDGDPLTYAWDLDGDGAFDDSSSATPSRTYTASGTVVVGLQVADGRGGFGTATVSVSVGNTAPVPTIAAPAATLTWAAGDTVSFSGSATDAQDGAVPAGRLTWTLVLRHCPGGCHEHVQATFPGVASGSFAAPDHSYPSNLELRLTATDSGGLTTTTSVIIEPKTVTLKLASVPAGAAIDLDDSTGTARSVTVIAKSRHTLTVAAPQLIGGVSHDFTAWSDGGARTHTITAPASGSVTYTATLVPAAGSCTDGTFKAEYFANTTSVGDPVLTRCEPRIANDWGNGAPPGVNVPADGFSVRWTGFVTTEARAYSINVSAADRVRVKIDEALVVDQWANREAASFSASPTLTAGRHKIEVKYAEFTGRAVARFQMAKALAGACSGWSTEFFASVDLTGAPKRSCLTTPTNDWGSGAPTGVGPDNWSARWTKTQSFTGGNTQFSVTCNDGCRLWLDGVLLIDEWTDRAVAQRFVATVPVAAGAHTVYLELYDRSGNAQIRYAAIAV